MNRPSQFDPWWHNWPLALAVAVGLALGIAGLAHAAADVTCSWDVSTSAQIDGLTGFRLYMTTTPGSYILGSTSPNLIATIPYVAGQVSYEATKSLVPAGTKYFVVTSYRGTEESPKSNEVSAVIELTAPNMKNPKITVSFTAGTSKVSVVAQSR